MPPKTPKGGKKKAAASPAPASASSQPSQARAAAPAPARTHPNLPTKSWSLAGPLMPFLLIAVPVIHVLLAPYTKVEESFTLHAAHDVLRYGIHPRGWWRWDHRTFPGAVPRSFIPSIILGIVSTPTAITMNVIGASATAIDVQQIVRLTLVCFWAYSMFEVIKVVKRRFGASTAYFFVLLSLLQFHVPFYAGRTLPNFVALPIVNLAIAWVLEEHYWHGVAILTAAATVIRLELALMAIPLAANLVLLGRLSFLDALTAGLAGGFGSLAIAAPIDYLLWSPTLPHPSLPDFTPLHTAWPELSAMLFNVVHGHAAEWGVMPRTYYLGALAKLLLGAFPLANLALMWAALQGLGTTAAPFDDKHLARTVRELVRVFGPSTTTLIAGLSGIGHKEWRFIVYAVPLLNLVAAAGAAALWALPHSGKRLVARFAVVGALLGTAAFTAFSTYVSSKNYPGGEVWRVLETLDIPAGSTIHFPSYPLQTGASLFTFTHERYSPTLGFPRQQEPNWVYSKDEDPALLLPEGAAGAAIDYVVTPDWENFAASGLWKEVASIDAYAGIRRGGKYFVEAVSDKKLAVLRRADLA